MNTPIEEEICLETKQQHNDNISSIKEHDGLKWFQRRRYHNLLMMFMAFFISYLFRSNLSMAVVSMSSPYNKTIENGTIVEMIDFPMTSTFKGYLFSSNFLGFTITHMLGGILASRYGSKWVITLSIFPPSIISILIPFLTQINIQNLIYLRLLEGLFSGMIFPCCVGFWISWAPPSEKTQLVSITFTGAYIGVMAMMFFGGIINTYLTWMGLFYLPGVVGVIFSILWILFVFSTPGEDRYISNEERNFLQNRISDDFIGKKIEQPWISFLTSLPCWAIVLCTFVRGWGFFTIMSEFPTFLKDVFSFNIEKTGYLSALPFIFMTISLSISSRISDKLIKKETLTTITVRKLVTCIGFIGASLFMLLIYFIPDVKGVLICMCISVFFHSATMSGFMVNWMDIAPSHASVLGGISSTIGSISGVIAPLVNSYFVVDGLFSEWMICFYIIAGLNIFASLFYIQFASGEIQSWVRTAKSTPISKV